MRLHSKKTKYFGRRWLALLLICGLLLPLAPRTEAVTVVYRYDWITDVSGLPTDDAWHDYFIAWEDDDAPGVYWFTDYNWFTLDGDSNIDVGGISWMEYKSQSKLPDTQSKSFTSSQCLGHMQIKFVGYDEDNDNSPQYHIRFSDKTDKYQYVDRWNPDPDPDSADDFTFQDKGDVFHIFVNIPHQADSYLTRDGDQLETSLSSSSSESEYPLRVYKRSVDTTIYDDQEENLPVEGKLPMYEYNLVDNVDKLFDMCEAATGKWTDFLLAWEDYTGGDNYNNPSEIWYTREIWYDDEGVNYVNDDKVGSLRDNYYYHSQSKLGADRYTSATTDSFTTLEPVSHFQLWHSPDKSEQLDDDNNIEGFTDSDDKERACPIVHIRFAGENGKYFYLTPYLLEKQMYESGISIQMFLDGSRKFDPEYSYGRAGLFWNKSGDDVWLTRWGNRLDISYDNLSSTSEYPVRLYSCTKVEYDAIIKSFTIGEGATYSIKGEVILQDGVTITVENGGVLMVDEMLYNNGHIHVKPGGTLILNEGASMMPFGAKSTGGGVTVEGGGLIVMDGAKLLLDEGSGTLSLKKGATVINRGVLSVSNKLDMSENSILRIERNGWFYPACGKANARGGVGAMPSEELRNGLTPVSQFRGYISQNSKLIHYGNLVPHAQYSKWYYSSGGQAQRLE